jgi:hypothetical protein
MFIPRWRLVPIGWRHGSSPRDLNATAVVAVDEIVVPLVGLLSARGNNRPSTRPPKC